MSERLRRTKPVVAEGVRVQFIFYPWAELKEGENIGRGQPNRNGGEFKKLREKLNDYRIDRKVQKDYNIVLNRDPDRKSIKKRSITIGL